MKIFLLAALLITLQHTTQSQVSYTWNGSLSSSWTTSGNWSPNGVPGVLDDVRIVTATNSCMLTTSTTINNITLASGTLDLNGGTLNVNGATAVFTAGIVQNGTLIVSAANTTTFGTGTVTMDCAVSIHTATISIRNTTFQGTVDITKTGSTGDPNNGNNIFNGTVTITNAGSGNCMLGNSGADKFYSDATFNNTGSANLYVAHNSSSNLFAGVTTFNNATTANTRTYVSWYSVGTVFNSNIIVSSTSGEGIQFCGGNATASVTLAAGYTISIGAGGFSAGTLLLRQFTQAGSAPLNLSFTGSAEVRFGPSGNFGGTVTVGSPNIYASSSVFNNEVVFTKTDGTSSNASQGGNTFNADLTANYISSNGTGYWSFANGAADIYNGDVYANNNSLDRIIFGHTSTNNQFNGNFIVTQTGASAGTALTWSNGSTAVMASGKTILLGGAGFNTGYFYIQGLTQNGSAPIHLTTTGTSSIYVGAGNTYNPSTIGGSFTVTAPNIYVAGATFNSDVNITKTGGGSNHNGGRLNIFNGTLSINQESNSGYFMLGYNSNDQFNDDIIVSSTGSGGINLGYSSGTGAPTLAAGKTIATGSGGFSDGYLNLYSFTQFGNTPMNLAFTGVNTTIRFARNSVIGGNLTVSSPDIYFDGCTFNGTVDATKTGNRSNTSRGGNIFNQRCTITSNGGNYWVLGNNDPDIWNDDVTFTNNGSERILPAWASAGNLFNGDIYLNTSGSATGIHFCGGNSTATATLAAGKTIQPVLTGLTAGYVILKQFTQLGNAPVNLSLSATATHLQFGPSSSFGGNVTSTSPGLYFNGCVFNGTVTATKTGTTNDASSGNNSFNNSTTITNAGSGYLLLGNGNADQFNSAATFNNTGSNHMYIAYNSSDNIFAGITTFNNTPVGNTAIYVSAYSANTVFNDNIVATSTGGQGVQFCTGNTTASATLAAGKTISIGGAGFSSGTLLLRQFTQLGATPQAFPLTGSAVLTFGPSSSFGGNVTSTSPGLLFNGCTFAGIVNTTKTGTTNDGSTGNNIFNNNTTITNTGSGHILLGSGNADQFNSAATFNNAGSSYIYVAHNSGNNIFRGTTAFNNAPVGNTAIYVSTHSANTVFNENIIVTSTSGQGVQFCTGNTTASATLAAGKTISIGGAGFSSGSLLLRQFTQLGTTSQSLSLTGSGRILFGPSSSFSGAVTTSSPGLFFNGCTFNATIHSTKTGTTDDQSAGNNIFNSTATFINNGTGYLIMAYSAPDAYNGDVSFIKNNTGPLYPNYNHNSTYAGHVSISSATVITFGTNNGTATFNGTGAQNISVTGGTPTPVFTRLVINNTGAGVHLNTPVNVSRSLVLTSGLLNTGATNILTMLNNSTVAAGTALSTSYINGPMRYQKSSSGSSVLNFPVGDGADCRPVALTVSHTNGTLYTYQTRVFNASAAALGYTLPSTVDKVSTVHYYTIGRTDASGNNQPTTGLSGNQTIQIFYGTNDITEDEYNGYAATIVKNTYNNTGAWIDIGGSPASIPIGQAGDITSTSSPTSFNSFSDFAIGFRKLVILPVSLLEFSAIAKSGYVDLAWTTGSEMKNSFFTIEKSGDGIQFEVMQTINSAAGEGNSTAALNYTARDTDPYNGNNYYRLKQTDIDGKYSYSKVIVVSFSSRLPVTVYPNPSAGTVYIKGLNVPTTQVEWYDTGGRIVAAQTVPVRNGIARLDMNLAAGMYILKYATGKGVWETQRVIIRK